MKLQEITMKTSMKNYSSPFSVIEVKENEKKKGKNYYQVIVSGGARVKRSWRTLKQSRAFTRVRGNAESDRIGSLSSLLFFSLHCGQPDRRIKRPWKDDYIFDQSAEAGTGQIRWPGKNCTRWNRRLDRHKASLRGKFSKASRPLSFFLAL